MGKKVKSKDSVVKIDSILLKDVDKFIQKEENRLKFVNKKQLIDLAVHDYLRQLAYPLSRAKKMEKLKK